MMSPRIWRVCYSMLSTLVLPASALLTAPLLARALGVEDRGLLAAITAQISFVPAVLASALPYATMRLTSSRGADRATTRASLLLGLTIGVGAVLALWSLAPLLLGNRSDARTVFMVLCLLLLPTMVLESLRGVRQGEGRYALMAVERTSGSLLRLVALVALFASSALTVASAASVQLGVAVVAGLVLIHSGTGKSRAAGTAPRRADVAAAARRLRSDMWRLWLSQVYFTAANRILLALALSLSSSEAVGLFAVAVAVADIPNVVVGAVNSLVVRRFAIAEDGADALVVGRVTAAAVLVIAVIGAAVVPFGVPLLFGAQFAGAVMVCEVLLLASAPLALAQILASGLGSGGTPAAAYPSQLFGMLTVLLGLVVLVPVLGALGCAVTALCAALVVCTLAARAACRQYGCGYRDVVIPRSNDVHQLLHG